MASEAPPPVRRASEVQHPAGVPDYFVTLSVRIFLLTAALIPAINNQYPTAEQVDAWTRGRFYPILT
ncbi:MAG TPA: hypothetical protein VNS63_22515 [Blastocatellia bacterium]|nr:hypothetical protein [Blastocatellia bacterium]